MACLSLSSGRNLGCKNNVGGLKAVYFADYGSFTPTTFVDGELTVISGDPDLFQYDLKGNGGGLTVALEF